VETPRRSPPQLCISFFEISTRDAEICSQGLYHTRYSSDNAEDRWTSMDRQRFFPAQQILDGWLYQPIAFVERSRAYGRHDRTTDELHRVGQRIRRAENARTRFRKGRTTQRAELSVEVLFSQGPELDSRRSTRRLNGERGSGWETERPVDPQYQRGVGLSGDACPMITSHP